MMDARSIRLDRMRYTRNTASARLALLAIAFDVFYFVSVYRINAEYYYSLMMGASILYNLVFMLAAFLSSEGVKSYKQGYSFVLCALGIIQIVRIFILPARAHATAVNVGGAEALAMSDGRFIWAVICLAASAVCLFASAAVNLVRSRALKAHVAGLK